METHDYLAALRRDGARLAEAATDLARAVPSCPEWDVAELVWHTGEVHSFWREIATGGTPDGYTLPERPSNPGLLPWFTEGVEATAALLEKLDPEQPAWSWAAQRNVRFIQRRMAQETAVHCWDALAAAGRDEPVERGLAADGIDEFLTFFLPEAAPEHIDVHLHATDASGEWLIRAGAEGWRIGHEHAKAAVAVRGTASDLLLLLWRRKRPVALETFGDTGMLEVFLAAAELA
ncbi:MAG TPA: maleylpyruvate isomerase family mycothiol-dependent enzyme [Amycolatopsis sp.]|uniref:maleylpyruvate isomerase family mycothiol-dependent enzyme n=1 Tax=Amycolatopsis sp. TaxID=37632 RepID=UPI002B49CCD2|nr:maleylpyruvate isomerase family mycothiol-dependent enzyme [Amycolatopsis sp.]HKS47276.1 maleylpyruvate isomerase family mycothiol-dependent enzyme [Amycolatopsis sp.]